MEPLFDYAYYLERGNFTQCNELMRTVLALAQVKTSERYILQAPGGVYKGIPIGEKVFVGNFWHAVRSMDEYLSKFGQKFFVCEYLYAIRTWDIEGMGAPTISQLINEIHTNLMTNDTLWIATVPDSVQLEPPRTTMTVTPLESHRLCIRRLEC